MEQNLGSGLSAKCVIVPGNVCNNNKKDPDYINKIVEIPSENSIMKKILLNEIVISKLIKERNKKGQDWLDNRYGIIEEVCPLKKITKSIKKKCELDMKSKDNYFIYIMKNSGCKPLTPKTKITLIDGQGVEIVKLTNKIIQVKNGGGSIFPIKKEDILFECGDFTNKGNLSKIYKLGLPFIIKMFKSLLESVSYLHEMGIIHCDLKHANIVMDEKNVVRIIDFGSAINLLKLSSSDFSDLCKTLPIIYSSKKAETLIKGELEGLGALSDYDYLQSVQSTLDLKLGAITMFFVPPEIMIANHFSSDDETIFEKVMENCVLSSRHSDEVNQLIKKKKQIVRDLFCKKNPEIFKYDVYSMGKFFDYILQMTQINNKKLESLITSMTSINYKKRPTIKQCLNHRLFK